MRYVWFRTQQVSLDRKISYEKLIPHILSYQERIISVTGTVQHIYRHTQNLGIWPPLQVGHVSYLAIILWNLQISMILYTLITPIIWPPPYFEIRSQFHN